MPKLFVCFVCQDNLLLSMHLVVITQFTYKPLAGVTPAYLADDCCRMLAVACCGRIPMNCSYHAHTANWVTEASQSPVPACGTTFHQGYDGRDCPLTLLNNLLKLTCLATEAHSDCIEFICAIQKTFKTVKYLA